MKTRMIIAGGRKYNDKAYFDAFMSRLKVKPDEIVDGTAKGADRLGFLWGRKNGVHVERFKPNIFAYGPTKAMLFRNTEMAEYGTCLLAFWDGESSGTAHMIREARRLKLPTKVIRYECTLDYDQHCNEIISYQYY